MFTSEAEFHNVAEKTLVSFADALDACDENGDLDVELQAGVLTIELNSGKQFIVNKHAPSQQIWLSSPVSGGLHFSYNDKQWKLVDGRELSSLLASELKTLAQIEVALA